MADVSRTGIWDESSQVCVCMCTSIFLWSTAASVTTLGNCTGKPAGYRTTTHSTFTQNSRCTPRFVHRKTDGEWKLRREWALVRWRFESEPGGGYCNILPSSSPPQLTQSPAILITFAQSLSNQLSSAPAPRLHTRRSMHAQYRTNQFPINSKIIHDFIYHVNTALFFIRS